MGEWFKDWFDSEDYLDVYRHRDDKDAGELVNLIIKQTGLKPGSFLLDAGCGAGRHSILFSERGFNVTGFDLSTTLLNKAKEEAAKKNIGINLLRADFRTITFKKKFDAVLNLFTSFGYFEDDEDNFHFVKEAHSFLKENGLYVFDYLNISYLKNNIVCQSEKNFCGKTVKEIRNISGGRVNKEIIITSEEFESRYSESVKLYSRDFIEKKFLSYGYRIKNIFGNYSGEEFDVSTSPRLIIIFSK